MLWYGDPTAIQRALGAPATLGTTLNAHLALIVWCKACAHQVEPDLAEQVARYGPDLTLLDWQQRLVCSRCGRRDIDFVVSGSRR
jgi:hypothetical protein